MSKSPYEPRKLPPVTKYAELARKQLANSPFRRPVEKRKASMSEWQPIETAPRDGTRILACNKNCIEIVKWDTFFLNPSGWLVRVNGESGFNYEERLQDVTHWMPLPALPT